LITKIPIFLFSNKLVDEKREKERRTPIIPQEKERSEIELIA